MGSPVHAFFWGMKILSSTANNIDQLTYWDSYVAARISLSLTGAHDQQRLLTWPTSTTYVDGDKSNTTINDNGHRKLRTDHDVG